MNWISPDVHVVRGWTEQEVLKKAEKVIARHPEAGLTADEPYRDNYRIFIKPWVVVVRMKG